MLVKQQVGDDDWIICLIETHLRSLDSRLNRFLNTLSRLPSTCYLTMTGDNCDEDCNGNGLMVVMILSVMVRTLVNDQHYTKIVVTFLPMSLSMQCFF